MTWQSEGACFEESLKRGSSDLFFEDPLEYAAKRICSTCPVTYDCLTYAVDNDIMEGVWGGMNWKERESWARRRRRLARIS